MPGSILFLIFRKMKQDISKELKIEENVNVEIDNGRVVVTGPLGKLERDFPYSYLSFEKKENMLIISTKNATKREKKLLGSVAAHIKNMILGVGKPYEYKLQICSVHFPMNVTVDSSNKKVIIKNFLGENTERKADILENTEVNVSNDIIKVTSIDKEAASQTAANIEMATRIKARDRRVFQDGIFITEKAGEKI